MIHESFKLMQFESFAFTNMICLFLKYIKWYLCSATIARLWRSTAAACNENLSKNLLFFFSRKKLINLTLGAKFITLLEHQFNSCVCFVCFRFNYFHNHKENDRGKVVFFFKLILKLSATVECDYFTLNRF